MALQLELPRCPAQHQRRECRILPLLVNLYLSPGRRYYTGLHAAVILLGPVSLSYTLVTIRLTKAESWEPTPVLWVHMLILAIRWFLELNVFRPRRFVRGYDQNLPQWRSFFSAPISWIDLAALLLGIIGLIIKRPELFITISTTSVSSVLILFRWELMPLWLCCLIDPCLCCPTSAHTVFYGFVQWLLFGEWPESKNARWAQVEDARKKFSVELIDFAGRFYSSARVNISVYDFEKMDLNWPGNVDLDRMLANCAGRQALHRQVPCDGTGRISNHELLWVIVAAIMLEHLALNKNFTEAQFKQALGSDDIVRAYVDVCCSALRLTPMAVGDICSKISPEAEDIVRTFTRSAILAGLVQLTYQSSIAFVVTVAAGEGSMVSATTMSGQVRKVPLRSASLSVAWLAEELRQVFGVNAARPLILVSLRGTILSMTEMISEVLQRDLDSIASAAPPTDILGSSCEVALFLD